jgi:hypothetical protein
MRHNANPRRSQKKRRLPLSQRATLTPEEFATCFGRQKIWAYRLAYSGRIKVITGFGNMMIPRSEIERVLDSAEAFRGGPVPAGLLDEHNEPGKL